MPITYALYLTDHPTEIRENLKGQDLSFTEIAKVVGERWQVLGAEERELCERQANGAKERYYAELADYKKTPQYESYQKYLEEFKAKHAVPTKGQYIHYNPLTGIELTGSEGKRSKLETETSNSTRSSSHDQYERAANRRLSSVQPDMSTTGLQMSESSPPIGSARLPAGPSFPSKPTSPASYPLSTMNSPRTNDPYSPNTASPRTTVFDASPMHPSRDPKIIPETNFSYPGATYPPPTHQLAPGMSPTRPFVSQYQPSMELPSRRSARDATRLPPLTHEDTTWSSESGHSGSGSGYQIPSLGTIGTMLPLDPVKTMRTLPQPIPSIGPSPSPLDRPLHPGLLPHPPPQQPDYRTQGPLAALIRAGELAARVADDEAMDVGDGP